MHMTAGKHYGRGKVRELSATDRLRGMVPNCCSCCPEMSVCVYVFEQKDHPLFVGRGHFKPQERNIHSEKSSGVDSLLSPSSTKVT